MNRQEGEEVVNCLYEGIELSDVEASLSPSVLSSSDATALEANDGKTKRYRRNCFVLSTTILFAFLIFTFAVFLDMFMNEPKISAGELGLDVFFPTNEDDIDMTNKDISTKIRSDYVIKQGSQRYLLTNAKCDLFYDGDINSFSGFHMQQSDVGSELNINVDVRQYHIVRDLLADVREVSDIRGMKPLTLSCAHPKVLFYAWGWSMFPIHVTAPVHIKRRISMSDLLGPKPLESESFSTRLDRFLSYGKQQLHFVAFNERSSSSVSFSVGFHVGNTEITSDDGDLNIKAFKIHFPEISYAVDRLEVGGDGWTVTTQPFLLDLLVQDTVVAPNVTISCNTGDQNDPDCSLYKPLFMESNMREDFDNYKHVNISTTATVENFFSNFLGSFHWIDFKKLRDSSEILDRNSHLALQQVDSDVSTGGDCVVINTDGVFFLDKCSVIDPNFFKLFINVRDSDYNDIVTLNSLTAWELEGPFATVSNTSMAIYDEIYTNVTLM
jgi:hypothetical protein